MGVSMDVFSEIVGPVGDYAAESGGYKLVWEGSGGTHLLKRHPEIPDVGWSYGNLVQSWDNVIAQYPSYAHVIGRIGSQGILFPDEVRAISEYLSTVEPLAEHGEDFAGRLQQLQELFRSAAELPGGIVYNS